MLKKILLGVVVFVVAVLGYAATRPDSFSLERTISISAAPEKVFAHLNDFHAWEAWSPWAKLDPAMTTTYDGATSGVGATYAWKGNSDVGEGKMEITGSTPATSVTIKLDFLSPFESHNTTVFTLTPNANGTDVTWTMSGPSTYMTKIMTSFVSMDKMVGPDFERGLQQLKTVSEK
ncbi:MAG: SRPBCC family protein [Gemmatimonadaceae bacterium]|nr:SRPBCC family protein [Gemmatimonadaceae bacterium]